jgi:hypothetical protein
MPHWLTDYYDIAVVAIIATGSLAVTALHVWHWVAREYRSCKKRKTSPRGTRPSDVGSHLSPAEHTPPPTARRNRGSRRGRSPRRRNGVQ